MDGQELGNRTGQREEVAKMGTSGWKGGTRGPERKRQSPCVRTQCECPRTGLGSICEGVSGCKGAEGGMSAHSCVSAAQLVTHGCDSMRLWV